MFFLFFSLLLLFLFFGQIFQKRSNKRSIKISKIALKYAFGFVPLPSLTMHVPADGAAELLDADFLAAGAPG